jgi:hypothetical protein
MRLLGFNGGALTAKEIAALNARRLASISETGTEIPEYQPELDPPPTQTYKSNRRTGSPSEWRDRANKLRGRAP